MRRTAYAICGLMLSLVATSAQAALVEWSFQAIVRDIAGSASGMADYGVEEGTLLSATFLLDNSVEGNVFGQNVWYEQSVVGIELEVGSFVAALDTNVTAFNSVVVHDGGFDAIGTSARLVVSNTPGSTNGFTAIEMIDSDGLMIDSTLFPSIPDFTHLDPYGGPGLDTYFLFQAFVGGAHTQVRAEIVGPTARIVPLPAAIYLLAGGLVTLLGLRHRTGHRRR